MNIKVMKENFEKMMEVMKEKLHSAKDELVCARCQGFASLTWMLDVWYSRANEAAVDVACRSTAASQGAERAIWWFMGVTIGPCCFSSASVVFDRVAPRQEFLDGFSFRTHG